MCVEEENRGEEEEAGENKRNWLGHVIRERKVRRMWWEGI